MRVGRTIAEERERIESESDRLAARELAKKHETMQTAIFVVTVVAIGVLIVISAKNFVVSGGATETAVSSETTYAPSVPVIDESGAKLSRKMSEFIGMVEADFKESGYTVTRVAIPTGMAREVDVYVAEGGGGGSSDGDNGGSSGGGDGSETEGVVNGALDTGELGYYFKMNIDRGSGVSVEDAVKMVKYLSERDLHPSYVDVRVEGKAFYR